MDCSHCSHAWMGLTRSTKRNDPMLKLVESGLFTMFYPCLTHVLPTSSYVSLVEGYKKAPSTVVMCRSTWTQPLVATHTYLVQLSQCWSTTDQPVVSGITGWWFRTFFIFPYTGNNHPNSQLTNIFHYFSEALKPPTRYLFEFCCPYMSLNITTINWRWASDISRYNLFTFYGTCLYKANGPDSDPVWSELELEYVLWYVPWS